ncbi:MAG: M20/M25/M40 family metallo-hydrolase [Thermoanaerobaculia bacterium]
MRKFILFLLFSVFLFSQSEEENLKKSIKYLSSKDLKGRMTGSEGAKKAAVFIENYLKNLSIETQSQKFPFISGNLLGKNNHFSIKFEGKEINLKLNKDFKPLPYSTSGFYEGDAIFAGYGINAPELEYDDYGGIDVKDKIVFVLRYNPYGKDPESPFSYYDRLSDKIITAREKGAKGIVFLTGPITEKEKKLELFKKDATGADLGIIALQISQKKGEEIFKMAGFNLKEVEKNLMETKKPKPLEMKEIKFKIQTELIQEKKECQNIIGVLKPSNWNGKFILLGAHYDHIGMGGETSRWEKKYGKVHPGADDNASGTALLLEMAGIFSKERENLKYRIVFAFFSGEELGLIGSSYFVKNPSINLKDISIMLNFDMVGRMRDKKLILLGTDTSPQIDSVIDEISKNYDFKIIKNLGGFSQGDNTAFYKEDIPVLGFFTDVHPDYHMPTDTYERINYNGMVQILNFAKEVTLKFQEIERIEFTPSKAVPKEGGKSAMKVYVGTIPEFGEDVEGYKIAGVQPSSPAERGGLQKGDIIIRVDGKEIKNIYDYMSAFKGKKVGERVEFEILRNGEILKKTITLESSKSREK